MSWKRIFVGLQNEYEKQERPGLPGRSAFYRPKGALTHHPQAGGGMALGHRALSEGIALSEESARQCLSASTAQQAKPLPCHRLLPAKTCHRQLFAVYEGRETKDGGN